MQRDNIDKKIIPEIISEIELLWNNRLEKHGDGLFVSPHETLGVIAEEYKEYMEDIHLNKCTEDELADIVIACLHGIASSRQKRLKKEI